QKKQPTPSQPKSTMKRNFGSGNYLDNTMMDYNNDKGGRLWEVDDNEARKILQEKKSAEDTLPKNVLDNLMHTCYHTCFLAYQIVDKDAFMQQYMSKEGLEPLLANSIHAWVSKHGCIYHHANNGHSATTMGEFYFKEARQSLKRCFDISSPTTIHALLNLYMYQLSSERSSLAYLYIGLAIRMAQDLKFHKKEHMSADLNQRETNKRLWWSAYWLDLCAALESNRPTMVDDKDCDLDYPVRLEHEDDETGYRVHFAVYSIKLMRIRKDITKHLPSEQSGQSLLSAISRLENALTNWLSELPNDLHFDDQASVFQKTGSFRDEACLILNIQYQTTWIMLHKFFLPKQDQTATPVALLSLNICTKAANLITRMLSIYAANLNWCQFFYAMDGIIASVTIHQVNAQSSEKEVSCLAQRNLIMTANVLKESPLMYMVRVCEIIESIEGFLKKNGLSSNLHDLPPVSEDSINQQSISSVFHPAVFDSQANVMPQPTNASYTGSLSPSVHSQHTMMNSPQSQHSNHMRVPSQLTPMFQSSSTQQQSSPAASSANSLNHLSTYSNLFLNDPTLMGFNMAAPSQPNTGDMNQLLLRDMGFDLNNERMYNMFTPRNTTNTTSHSFPNNAPYSQFNNNFNSFENT
ncbi:Transcriptional activator, partial [Rhizopus stolonifer]